MLCLPVPESSIVITYCLTQCSTEHWAVYRSTVLWGDGPLRQTKTKREKSIADLMTWGHPESSYFIGHPLHYDCALFWPRILQFSWRSTVERAREQTGDWRVLECSFPLRLSHPCACQRLSEAPYIREYRSQLVKLFQWSEWTLHMATDGMNMLHLGLCCGLARFKWIPFTETACTRTSHKEETHFAAFSLEIYI